MILRSIGRRSVIRWISTHCLVSLSGVIVRCVVRCVVWPVVWCVVRYVVWCMLGWLSTEKGASMDGNESLTLALFVMAIVPNGL